jgi:predicted phosphodiesterase
MIPTLRKGKSKGVYICDVTYDTNDWSKKFMLLSDIHYDAVGCQRKKLKQTLDYALENDMGIMVLGDIMDLAQGKRDKRHSRNALRPEYLFDDYIGAVVNDTAEMLAPYVNNIMMISRGNHEQSYMTHNLVDPLSMLSHQIKELTGKRITIAPYGGYVLFRCSQLFKTGKTGSRETIYMKYHHGSGGGNSPVTKGAIQSARSIAKFPQSDITCLGHIHQRFSMYMPRELVTANGTVITDRDALHLQLGTFLQDTDPNAWSQRMGYGMSALGGWILRLYCNTSYGPKRVRYMAIPTD